MSKPTVGPNAHRRASAPGTSRRESGRPSGWDRYLEVLMRARVPANARRWSVQRAEDFVAALCPKAEPGDVGGQKRLGELSAEEITAFFSRYARAERLTDWQFRQTVDAVQLLLVDVAQCAAAREVDWDCLRESGRVLEATHPTRAAQMTPEAAVAANPVYSRAAEAQPLLKRLAHALRSERYALRTEQTYVDWCHRLLLFCQAAEGG